MLLNLALILALVPPLAIGVDAYVVNAAPAIAAPGVAQSLPNGRFVPVEGGSLAARIETAAARARTASQQRYWIAYGIDVRPGVAVDTEFRKKDGMTVSGDSFGLDAGSKDETRNLAIFALYANGALERLEIYNLERARDYEKLPVYWTGRPTSDESFAYLEGLIVPGAKNWIAERAVVAISIHADPRAADRLEGIVRSSRVENARNSAVMMLGVSTDRAGFLASVVRDEREPRELRRQAAMAIGVGKSPQAVATLRSLFAEVRTPDVREHVIVATAVHDERSSSDETIDFLIEVATKEADTELRRHALFWLGQKAGQRAFGALVDAVDSPDEDVAEHAVFALSQRSKDEAIPILIEIARNHRSPSVRRKAVFWLGQIDDERVIAFLKELLER